MVCSHRGIQALSCLTLLTELDTGGHVLMVDIMKEMKQPTDFHKSVWLSQLFMCFNYAVVGYPAMLCLI